MFIAKFDDLNCEVEGGVAKFNGGYTMRGGIGDSEQVLFTADGRAASNGPSGAGGAQPYSGDQPKADPSSYNAAYPFVRKVKCR